MAATFDGAAIFGQSVSMRTAQRPVAIQRSAYPQVNGIEAVNMGSRGRMTEVRGIFQAPNLASLNAAMATLRSYHQTAYVSVLITTAGEPFAYCLIADLQEATELLRAGNGDLVRPYVALIEHLV